MTGSSTVHAVEHATNRILTLPSATSNLLLLNPPQFPQFQLTTLSTNMEMNAVLQLILSFAAKTARTAICLGLTMILQSGTLTMPPADASQTNVLLKVIPMETTRAIILMPASVMETATATTAGLLMMLINGTLPKLCTDANPLKKRSPLSFTTALTALTPTTCSAVPTATNAASHGLPTTLRCGTLMTCSAAASLRISVKLYSVTAAPHWMKASVEHTAASATCHGKQLTWQVNLAQQPTADASATGDLSPL